MSAHQSEVRPVKSFEACLTRSPEILIPDKWIPEPMQREYSPKSELGKLIMDCRRYLPEEQAAELIDRLASTLIVEGWISDVVFTHWDDRIGAFIQDEQHERLGYKVITTAGVNFLVQDWTGSGSLNSFKFHGLGTGTAAEATSDTALGTELTTQYAVSNTRATGTTVTGSSNNIIKTVATNTLSSGSGLSITEFGLFSNASVGSGTLWDRLAHATTSAFGPYTMSSGDSLAITYQTQFAAGG